MVGFRRFLRRRFNEIMTKQKKAANIGRFFLFCHPGKELLKPAFSPLYGFILHLTR